MKDAFCVRSLNRMFFTLIVVGIMAFASFLLVCCLLCFNVRHYQAYMQKTVREDKEIEKEKPIMERAKKEER